MPSHPASPATPDGTPANFLQRASHWAIARIVIYVAVTAVIVVCTGLVARFVVPAGPPLRHHLLLMLTNAVSVVAVLAAYAGLVRWLERRSASELALRNGLPLLFAGAVIGLALISTVYFVLWQLGLATFVRGTGWAGLDGIAVVTLAAAALEELVFRAVLFRIVEQAMGTAVAVIVSAVAFGWAHGLNPGATVLGMAAIALEGGVMFSLAYVATRNLWLSIGIHMSWNFGEGSVFGARVSGFRASHTMYQSSLSGSALLTGGSFGPEASIIAMGLCALTAAVFALIILRRGGWQRLTFRLRLE